MAILKPDKTRTLGGVTVNEFLLTKHNPRNIAMPSVKMEGIIGVTVHNTDWIRVANGTTPAEQYTRATYNSNILGLTPYKIAANLTAQGVPTPGGKRKWAISTIKSILTNEKYKGDALLQKRFTVDFLTKKTKISESVLVAFDDNVWNAVLENLTVFHDGSMVFLFKDGTEIKN